MKQTLLFLMLLSAVCAGAQSASAPFAIVKVRRYADPYQLGGVVAYYGDGTPINISDSIGLERNSKTLAYDTSTARIQLNLLTYFDKRGYSLTAVSDQDYFFRRR